MEISHAQLSGIDRAIPIYQNPYQKSSTAEVAVPALTGPLLSGSEPADHHRTPLSDPRPARTPLQPVRVLPILENVCMGAVLRVNRTLHGWQVCANIIQGGRLAQVVERWFHEPEVRGSSPLSPTSQSGWSCMMARVPHMSPLGDEAIISSEECMLQRSTFASVGRQNHHSCCMQEHGCGA